MKKKCLEKPKMQNKHQKIFFCCRGPNLQGGGHGGKRCGNPEKLQSNHVGFLWVCRVVESDFKKSNKSRMPKSF